MNNMQDIENKTADFIKQHNLPSAKGNVLLAVSGGADSVALLYILYKLCPKDLRIAHINHQLRSSESLKDEEYVKSLADKFNLPITIESVDVKAYAKENRLSIETAARKLRLDALCRIADKYKCRYIATAHHKNDNAETVIHRILRGTGFKGLAGIRPMTIINGKTFIRPLLCLSRRQIEEYLKSQNISWQTDHTNIDCRFTRNRIRHRLLPLLQSQSRDDLTELLFALSQKCLAFSEKIERQAKKALPNCTINQSKHSVSMNTEKFNDYPSLLKVEIIQSALQQCGIGLQKITTEHYNKTIKFLAQSQTGKILQLPNNTVIKKEQKSFSLGRPQICTKNAEPVELKMPGSVCFGDWVIETQTLPADDLNIKNLKKNKNNFIEWFDSNQVKRPLVARCRQKGDRFRPFGLGASKKIGKFITSAKTGPDQRKTAFLICDSEKVLWLVPIRRSSEAVITHKSKELLQIKTSKNRPEDI
ncbi:MAG: tRNA lysidine(34) synthetase TilS [Planctomycetes bacterium HGW-Planctomycetes-1]|nr:MAG: tRNA lysidine(34) synthetase TilS [Planctomycetes bacterium HGW-Planctomycetes-1]